MAATPALAMGAALTVLSFATPVLAQLKLSAAVDSDNRYRGLSQSGGRPTLTLGAGYDHPSGVYVGASAIAANIAQTGLELVGDTEYLGYARRDAGGRSWDIGVNRHAIEVYGAVRRSFDYNNIYVGLAKNDLSGHIYYSPNYFAKGARVAYFDLNGAIRQGENWRLLGHLGLLTPLGGGPAGRAPRRDRIDVRAGVVRTFRNGEIRLTWTGTLPRPQPETSQSQPGLVLGASVYF